MTRQFEAVERGRTRRMAPSAALVAGVIFLVQVAAADDRAEINFQVIGNRELPKVIYIVPWKRPGPGDLSGMPVESVLDEALAPLDRDVFRRQIRYDRQLRPGAAPERAPTDGGEAPASAPQQR